MINPYTPQPRCKTRDEVHTPKHSRHLVGPMKEPIALKTPTFKLTDLLACAWIQESIRQKAPNLRMG